ncbi:hypothetical protein E4U34_002156 [Claviceps purpurea]|nr:hypothetical protein E4U38_002489 [Claviceps purpurea]KAG6198451.1 hypothetical protein E4U10_006766 [Claviceps purpurea]KAG6221291.1 hypothetical protein E4U34_002156 [Claviceps purpurea]KAG6232477.1 hypothetical protein E4U25_006699 [Claviceps purpurea]KAG6253286.1 hypothetical protein E4U23_007868 [Claviceps purpurea]
MPLSEVPSPNATKPESEQPISQPQTETPAVSPRAVPCKGCVRAAIAGKGELGRCYDIDGGRSRRCLSCKVGNHRCDDLHPVMIPLARRMLLALDIDTKMYNRCRQALRLQLELIAEEDSVYGPENICEESSAGAATDRTAAEKKDKVAAIMTRLEDVVRLMV